MPRLTQNLGASHYAAVAAALRAELDHAEDVYQDKEGEAYLAHRYAIQCTMSRLIMIYMAADTPARKPFDAPRFREACGFPDGGSTN